VPTKPSRDLFNRPHTESGVRDELLEGRQVARLKFLSPSPAEAINVSACYGLALLNPVDAPAQAFAQYLLGFGGQAILASHGFSAPNHTHPH